MKDFNPEPRPGQPPAQSTATEESEWRIGADCVIDHAGTEISFRLQVAADGHSFTLTFRDNQTRTVKVEGESLIKFVIPSVEGPVIWCQLMNGCTRFYDVHDGRELTEVELRKINPQFYN